MIDRFVNAETGLAEFVQESQDFSFAEPHWGFKGYAQMQLNQYLKIADAAGLVEVHGSHTATRAARSRPGPTTQARGAICDPFSK